MKKEIILIVLAGISLAAQPRKLTLREARDIALRGNPQVSSALLRARAAEQVVTETHAAALPTITGQAGAADALDSSRIAAGGLNNPVIYSRMAAGITGSQIICGLRIAHHDVRSTVDELLLIGFFRRPE